MIESAIFDDIFIKYNNQVVEHYKGGIYKVIGRAMHTEDKSELIIYQHMGTMKIFARPIAMFFEDVIVDSQKMPRFKLLEHGAPPYPPGMGEESRRLHREYNLLVKAQLNGANNAADVVRLTDECYSKGIILVPEGENR